MIDRLNRNKSQCNLVRIKRQTTSQKMPIKLITCINGSIWDISQRRFHRCALLLLKSCRPSLITTGHTAHSLNRHHWKRFRNEIKFNEKKNCNENSCRDDERQHQQKMVKTALGVCLHANFHFSSFDFIICYSTICRIVFDTFCDCLSQVVHWFTRLQTKNYWLVLYHLAVKIAAAVHQACIQKYRIQLFWSLLKTIRVNKCLK